MHTIQLALRPDLTIPRVFYAKLIHVIHVEIALFPLCTQPLLIGPDFFPSL